MRAFSPGALAFVLGAVAIDGCRCETTPITPAVCGFTVEPSGEGQVLTFPDTQVGHTSTRSWRITNTGVKGGTAVVLSDLKATFDPRNGQNYATDIPSGLHITKGEQQTFVITFTPVGAADFASSFTVTHPDVGPAKCPSVTVFVDGRGFVPPPVDAGPEDGGEPDGGQRGDAGPVVDGGTVEAPDGGVTLPVDGQWFAYGAFEDARARFAAVEAQDGTGDIIAFGGYGEDGTPIDSIERFNPNKGVSRIVGHMAIPRAEPAVATLPDKRIVILGGRSAAVGGVAVRTVEIFDPVHGDQLTCADSATGSCGINDQNSAILPTGRIGGFASTLSDGSIAFVLGRTLDTNGNEIVAGGGDVITFAPLLTRADLVNGGLLTGRVGDARVANVGKNAVGGTPGGDGSFLVVGGDEPGGGNVVADVFLVNTSGASLLTSLANKRAFASAALLSTGDVLVAGGAKTGPTGTPEDHVERIAHPFGGGTVAVSPVTLTLTSRISGSLVALDNDFLLWAGGTTAVRADFLSDAQSVVPSTSADVIVPFGSSGFVRLSPDNDLAAGRLDHVALAYASVLTGQGAGVLDTALFLGGTSTAPRRTPHPHIERYLVANNAFQTYGLMGAGTALEAGVLPSATGSAALVSAGGIDPHTGSTSALVRAFDAVAGAYVDDGELREPRRDHTLTRIADNPANALLVAGGRDENGVVLDSLSIYDSVNELDHALPVHLATPRAQQTATRLADDGPLGPGAVLLCGGIGANGEALDSCEVFIPPSNPLDESTYNTASVIPVSGRLSTGRVGHTATLLDSGNVLVVGGGNVANAAVGGDIFAPDATLPSLHATNGVPIARTGHAALFLGSGEVLIAGGSVAADGTSIIEPTATAELYVESQDAFLQLPDMREERANPALFLLTGGEVLVAGGTKSNSADPANPTKSDKTSELYSVATQSFEPLDAVPLSFGRSDVLFVDVFGRAIVYGGDHRDGILGTGDERHTPITFVDFLQDPGTAVGP